MFRIFAGTSFHSFVLNLYLVKAFGAKEISEILRYHTLLNVLRLLIVGIVVAECVGNTLRLCLLFSFSFPCLSYIFFLTFVTDDDIYEVKTIVYEAFFQFKSNLNVFKSVAIIHQEIDAAFIPFITIVKRTR